MSDHVTITVIGCGWSNTFMKRYVVAVNYIQLRDNDKNKGVIMYTDGSPKSFGNILGFINNTWPETTNKKPNCIFEGSEGN